MWGFCASFGVYLASVLVPNTFAPPGFDRDGLTAGMTIFVAVRRGSDAGRSPIPPAGALAFFWASGSAAPCWASGMAFFWLTYALTGLARISGPHRPDAFYGFSLSLMVVALLLRFADRFAAKIRAQASPCANRPEISDISQDLNCTPSCGDAPGCGLPGTGSPKKTCFTVRAFEGANKGSTGKHASQTRPDARHSDGRGRRSGFRAGQLRRADPARRAGWPHRHPAAD